jgi:uncharacterized protein (TIGR02246 family)
MVRISILVTVLLAALALSGAPVAAVTAQEAGDGAQDAQDRAAIEQAWAGYSEALTGADADAFATLFTEDALWRQPVAGELTGRDAIRDFMAAGFAQGSIERMTVQSEDLRIHGDRAYEVGLYGQTTTFTASGESRESGGSFGAWWEKGDDGVWRIAHMMIVPAAGRPAGSAR